MVAVLIITGSLFFLAQVLLISAGSSGKLTLRQKAVQAASQQLQAIKSLPYNQVAFGRVSSDSTATSATTASDNIKSNANSVSSYSAANEYNSVAPGDMGDLTTDKGLPATNQSTSSTTGAILPKQPVLCVRPANANSPVVDTSKECTDLSSAEVASKMVMYTYIYVQASASPACVSGTCKTVVVKVLWNDPNGSRQQVSLKGFVDKAATSGACSLT